MREALEVSAIPYMVTGSFVSAVHGIPRSTHDIDVVIAPTAQQLVTLLQQFPVSEYYAELEDAMQALRHNTQFNIIDERGAWKLDFILRKNRPFNKKEFERRKPVSIFGLLVDAATAEDLLIAKLEWAKIGDSERQIRDAAGIVAIQGPALDIDYVERWVAALDLEDQWQLARKEESSQ
jgi:hypothetical protein